MVFYTVMSGEHCLLIRFYRIQQVYIRVYYYDSFDPMFWEKKFIVIHTVIDLGIRGGTYHNIQNTNNCVIRRSDDTICDFCNVLYFIDSALSVFDI